METGGASTRTGGLNICLSGTDGRIVGGGVGGPLIAAVPVQVFVVESPSTVLYFFIILLKKCLTESRLLLVPS